MTRFFKATWTITLPLLAIIIFGLCNTQMQLVQPPTMMKIDNLGTVLVMCFNMVYIVAFRTRSHWPGIAWYQRLIKVLSFER